MPSIANIIRKATQKLTGGQSASIAGAQGALSGAAPVATQVAQQGKKDGGQKA